MGQDIGCSGRKDCQWYFAAHETVGDFVDCSIPPSCNNQIGTLCNCLAHERRRRVWTGRGYEPGGRPLLGKPFDDTLEQVLSAGQAACKWVVNNNRLSIFAMGVFQTPHYRF